MQALGTAVVPLPQQHQPHRALPPICRRALAHAGRASSSLPQSELGDVVYAELPEVGSTSTKGERLAIVESVKVGAARWRVLARAGGRTSRYLRQPGRASGRRGCWA